ncbi:hypothetical protein niasHS_011715 [Heterodera schachtii]|uniref:F-box domain-containing protein n=1 Tax=Heterodera schachtii TaxID=97005 RepID=A0ABD2IT88_HETSC
MKRHSDGCFTETSKKGKFSKRLPIELLWELIMCIPMMRLFDGSAEKKRWLSMIDPINWQFEVVRQSRKNEHNAFKNRLAMLNEKFNQTCELRKVPFDNEQLLSAVFRIKDQLLMEQYFAEILQYLCFSRFNRGVVTDNFSVASPLINSIVNGKLCGQLIDFILCSPNPFCIRKRICVGVMLPKDLPTCLNQTACEMNRNGILPQVRSDGNTVLLALQCAFDEESTAFASEFLTDAKNRLNAKIEEIEARILYFLARDSKLKALNQLGAEIEREVNVLENMFP